MPNLKLRRVTQSSQVDCRGEIYYGVESRNLDLIFEKVSTQNSITATLQRQK